MSDILTELQTLVNARIVAHADLTELTVVNETNADAESQVLAAIRTEGVAALLVMGGVQPTETEGLCAVDFAVEIHEDVEVNNAGGDALGVAAVDIAEKICFAQFKQWTPSAVFQVVQQIGYRKIEVAPHAIIEVTAETRIYIP